MEIHYRKDQNNKKSGEESTPAIKNQDITK
jgi:hypothetical protein